MGALQNLKLCPSRSGNERRHGGMPTFLWVNLMGRPSALFQLTWGVIRGRVSGREIAGIGDLDAALCDRIPCFLCFEYDDPKLHDLGMVFMSAHRYPDLPVIVLTDKHSEALENGALRTRVRCLAKPVALDELLETFGRLLGLALGNPGHDDPGAIVHPVDVRRDWLPDTDERPSPPPRTGAALEYVARSYAADITRRAAAEACHLSSSQFSRIFKRDYGVAFRDYLCRYRLARARELLATAISVKEVAFGTGFHDISYFARLFRSHMGMTPGEYRARRATRRPCPPWGQDPA